MRWFLKQVRGQWLGALALFVSLAGVSYAAAVLPANSVGTKQLRKGSVTLKKISAGARKSLRGARGRAGATGAAGARGADGQSVASSALASGDATCAAGGSKFTSASGVTYACNGAAGPSFGDYGTLADYVPPAGTPFCTGDVAMGTLVLKHPARLFLSGSMSFTDAGTTAATSTTLAVIVRDGTGTVVGQAGTAKAALATTTQIAHLATDAGSAVPTFQPGSYQVLARVSVLRGSGKPCDAHVGSIQASWLEVGATND